VSEVREVCGVIAAAAGQPSSPTVVKPACWIWRAVGSTICRKGRSASFSMRSLAVWTVLHASRKKSAPAALR
jgi:hypothetical protein